MYEENRKKKLSYKKYRNAQLKISAMLCLAGFVAVAFILPIVVFAISACFEDVGVYFSTERAFAGVMMIVLGIVMLAILAFCMIPFILGLCRIINVLRYYEIVIDELEYVKPFEKEKVEYRSHRHSRRIWLHGLYFKERGKHLVTTDPDKYTAGEKYYLEICGKNKIIEVFSYDDYELVS